MLFRNKSEKHIEFHTEYGIFLEYFYRVFHQNCLKVCTYYCIITNTIAHKSTLHLTSFHNKQKVHCYCFLSETMELFAFVFKCSSLDSELEYKFVSLVLFQLPSTLISSLRKNQIPNLICKNFPLFSDLLNHWKKFPTVSTLKSMPIYNKKLAI